MKLSLRSAVFAFILSFAISSFSQTVLIETETFQSLGGWVVDPQFTFEMGSPYLLAHGLGTPLADASTNVQLPSTGVYRVWARTKDWVAQWNAPGAPGKFQISINNLKLDTIFGTRNAKWSWQYGGRINITNSNVQLKLIDLTGFEGRCDAIILSKDETFQPSEDAATLAVWRNQMHGNTVARNVGKYDLVIIGGGIAGTTAAISSARLGLKVALIQDRPVVGGNNSTEVRVLLQGALKMAPFPNLGNVVSEITVPVNPKQYTGHSEGKDSIYDDSMRMNLLNKEPNITLFMNFKADSVSMNERSIQSVFAQYTLNGERIEVFGTYFSDCTGDGTVGYLAGADYEISLKQHMGSSNLWNLKEYPTAQPFAPCPWALNLSDKPFPGRPGIDGAYGVTAIDALGGWFWESGFSRNPITEAECIRDNNFRAMYGAWDCVKNTDKIYPNFKLNWAAYISGKRESRLILGDVILNKNHLLDNIKFPDGLIAVGWNMDVHVPNINFQLGFEGDEFISHDIQTTFKRPFYIPYRCLYSRNLDNLFMAGRDISVTRDALGTVRVMNTTGMMGEVVGMAAAICKKNAVLPKAIFSNHLSELRNYAHTGVPSAGQPFVINPIIEPNPSNPQIVIDNTDPGCTFSNTWYTSSYQGGYLGADYVNDGTPAADVNKWAKWTPIISQPGKFKVYINWTDGTNRPIDAPIEINSSNGIKTIIVDQTKNGGVWNYLGEYQFNSGNSGYVKILCTSKGYTISDAVLFENVTGTTDIDKIENAKSSLYVFSGSKKSTIVLDLIEDANVSLSLYSLYGVKVQDIISENQLSANRYNYNLKSESIQSGVYLINLTINGKPAVCKKLIIN